MFERLTEELLELTAENRGCARALYALKIDCCSCSCCGCVAFCG